jgi:hypothetical protein
MKQSNPVRLCRCFRRQEYVPVAAPVVFCQNRPRHDAKSKELARSLRNGSTRNRLLAFAALMLTSFAHANSPCKLEAQYDMLQWTSMDHTLWSSYHFAGSANPLYSAIQAGELFLIKGAKGFPWDIDPYDNSYIYLWITEYDWNDPSTYKAFVNPMPWMPRCIDIPAKRGTKLSSIFVTDANYNIYLTGCTRQPTQNLGHVVNEVWGPYQKTLGGSLPASADTLELNYRYACDSTYHNCTYKETFDFQKGLGLVQWTYYILENGTYVQQNQSIFNILTVGGTPKPDTPCLR